MAIDPCGQCDEIAARQHQERHRGPEFLESQPPFPQHKNDVLLHILLPSTLDPCLSCLCLSRVCLGKYLNKKMSGVLQHPDEETLELARFGMTEAPQEMIEHLNRTLPQFR